MQEKTNNTVIWLAIVVLMPPLGCKDSIIVGAFESEKKALQAAKKYARAFKQVKTEPMALHYTLGIAENPKECYEYETWEMEE